MAGGEIARRRLGWPGVSAQVCAHLPRLMWLLLLCACVTQQTFSSSEWAWADLRLDRAFSCHRDPQGSGKTEEASLGSIVPTADFAACEDEDEPASDDEVGGGRGR